MTLGYIGHCKKYEEDDQMIFYAYSGSDWNSPTNNKDAENAYDGMLFIDKSVLNLQRDKAKRQTEYIDWCINAIINGAAGVLQPCQNAFHRGVPDIDCIANHCLFHIFERVYRDGVFPEREGFIQ